jgi:putative tryptophan/tyrosine transport system substrate-binding protein
MRRREFIAFVGSTAAAWPLATRAQQARPPVIGVLAVRTPEFDAPLVDAFKRGMNETGYFDGKNIVIEYRWAAGHFDRLPALADELVQKQVALIVTFGGTASARAAKTAISSIPIVFAIGDDPVKLGLVTNLSRPEGNITGATNFYGELAAKQLGLLRGLVPSAAVIAIIANPNEPAGEFQISDAQAAAKSIQQELIVFRASTESEIDTAFANLVQQHAGALLLGANPFFVTRISQIVALANRYAVPAMYWRRELVEAGGLISYGANPTEIYTVIGRYAGRILAGAKPADLPVQLPTKFELVINLKTAKALGLDVSPELLATADEVIE